MRKVFAVNVVENHCEQFLYARVDDCFQCAARNGDGIEAWRAGRYGKPRRSARRSDKRRRVFLQLVTLHLRERDCGTDIVGHVIAAYSHDACVYEPSAFVQRIGCGSSAHVYLKYAGIAVCGS